MMRLYLFIQAEVRLVYADTDPLLGMEVIVGILVVVDFDTRYLQVGHVE